MGWSRRIGGVAVLSRGSIWFAPAGAGLLFAAVAGASPQHRAVLGLALEERVDDGALASGGAELMSKLSPEVGYELKSEQRDLTAAYDADLIHHLVAGNVGLDHRGRLRYRDEPTERLELHLDATLYRVEDSSTLPRFGVARTQSAALWLKGELALDYRLSHRDTAELGYRTEATRLYANGLPLTSVHALAGEVRREVGRRLELGVRYRAQLFTAGLTPRAHTHAVSGTLRFTLARHTFLAVDAGPVLFAASGLRSVTPRVGAELGYEARGVELGVVGGRDYVGAAGFATAIWADYVQVAAAWKVSRAVSLNAAGGLYRNGVAPAGPVDAQGWGAGAGFEWRFAKELSAELSYNRISQLGTAAVPGLSRNIASARLTYRVP